jgi:CheY-like chemotaxis protein
MQATKKVLVIDDDPVVGKSFQRVLSGKGYAVISAASGTEALERLAREDYDVVYADIKMPGMSGLEVTERIKATRPWLPVVIVTGYGSEANEARAKELGVSAFLHKPLSPEMIEGSAQDALRQEPKAETRSSAGLFVKNVALFLAAPFIGLAYVVALPFVGLGLLGWLVVKALLHRRVDVDQAASSERRVP